MVNEEKVANIHAVGTTGDKIVIMNPPIARMPISKEDALFFAAWLVALADESDEFPHYLEAVENT